MIIGLAGYHSSGKSALADFLVERCGWKHVVKRLLLKEWSGLGEDEAEWTAWYRNLYQRMDSYDVMQHLLRQMQYDRSKPGVTLLDAIHTHGEWRAVQEWDPDSILAGVFVPKSTRLERSTQEDLSLDVKRARFWHSEDRSGCLLAEIGWSFNGSAGLELRELEAEGLRSHLEKMGKLG